MQPAVHHRRMRHMLRCLPLFLTVIGVMIPCDAVAQSSRSSNVTALGYARLGFGAAIAGQPRRAPAIGFGFRGERGDVALDVSVFNYVVSFDPYDDTTDMLVGSRLKLTALHFTSPDQDRSAYVGAGLSWGGASMGRGGEPRTTYASSWHGNGLQVELTTGYELGRSGDMRLFIQGDASIPLFKVTSTTFAPGPGANGGVMFGVEHRYIPSAVVSVGIGWSR